jgi:hypothetical protein
MNSKNVRFSPYLFQSTLVSKAKSCEECLTIISDTGSRPAHRHIADLSGRGCAFWPAGAMLRQAERPPWKREKGKKGQGRVLKRRSPRLMLR